MLQLEFFLNKFLNKFFICNSLFLCNSISWIFSCIALIVFCAAAPAMFMYKTSTNSVQFKFTMSIYVTFFINAILFFLLNDLVFIFCAWEGMALLSYFLIRFSNTHEAINSAKTSLLTNAISGVFLLVCFIILKKNGAHSLSDIQNISISQPMELVCVNLFFLIAIMIKSAQFPFHFWILKAMKAPAPVSALLHSCTIVKAGLYLFIQLLIANETIFSMAIHWIKYISIITILYTFLKTFFCRQIKKILALTTISNLALMYYFIPDLVIFTKSHTINSFKAIKSIPGTLEIIQHSTISTIEILIFFYVANHAIYKAIMFLIAGLLEKRHQLTVINKIKDAKQNYCTILITMMCFLAALGMPFCLGKISKNILHMVEIPMPIYMIFSINSAVILHLLHLMIRSIFRKSSPPTTKNKKAEKLLFLFSITTIIVIPIYIIHNDSILIQNLMQNISQNITQNIIQSTSLTHSIIHNILHNTFENIFQQHMHFVDHAFIIFTMFFAYMLTINLIPFNHIQQPMLLYRFKSQIHNIKSDVHSMLSSTKYNLSKLTHIFKISFFIIVVYTFIQTDWTHLFHYVNESLSHLIHLTAKTFENAFIETHLMMINLLIAIIGITFIQTNTAFMQIIGSSLIGISVGMIYISLGAPDVAITHFLSETVAMLFLYSICKDNHFTNHITKGLTSNLTNHFSNSDITINSTNSTNSINRKKSFFRQNIFLKSILLGLGISIFILLLNIDQTYLNNVAVENYIHLSSHRNNIVNLIVTDYRGFDTFGEMTAICISGFIIYASRAQKTQNSRLDNNYECNNVNNDDDNNSVNNNSNNDNNENSKNFSQLIFSEHFMQSAKSLHLIIPLVSIIMITQGHNIPGGGFIVGLMMSLYFYAVNVQIKFNLIIFGIVLAILSSIIPLFLDYSFFTNMVNFQKYGLPIEHFSFAMIFDTSIMLAVIGMINIGRSNL